MEMGKTAYRPPRIGVVACKHACDDHHLRTHGKVRSIVLAVLHIALLLYHRSGSACYSRGQGLAKTAAYGYDNSCDSIPCTFCSILQQWRQGEGQGFGRSRPACPYRIFFRRRANDDSAICLDSRGLFNGTLS